MASVEESEESHMIDEGVRRNEERKNSQENDSFSTVDDLSVNNRVLCHNDFNFVLANARSLKPKLLALIDTLEEIDGHVSVITETWFRRSDSLEKLLRDTEDITGYGFIRRDRYQGEGQVVRGGGVAIVYKKSNFEMIPLKIEGTHEIVAALGRRTGQKRKLITIGAYIPPSADADSTACFLDTITDSVRRFKAKYNSPYFVIAGDFNKRKVAAELREFTDIKLVKTGPTRGKNALDLIFTNFPNFIKECGTLPALFNSEGVVSDHLAVHLYAKMPRVPEYTIEKYSYIKQTDEGDAKLMKMLGETDWRKVTAQTTPTDMVDELHTIFKEAMNKCYDTITTVRKSTQPQWINSYVIDLIAQRRAIFRREGRSDAWKRMKKKTRAIIKRRKARFNKRKREKMLGADSRTFHKTVKSFVTDEKSKHWSPTHMYPGLKPVEVAEKCAEFFNSISAEYEPLDLTQIPTTHDTEPIRITPKGVEMEIKRGKKPKSRVEGDLFISALVQNLTTLAPIIAAVFNRVVESGEWPRAWQVEHVTIIPKGNQPDEPAKCRNISCTNFLSKVLERMVLGYAKKQVRPKTNQFGGEKNCSTNHFLAEVWDKLTDHLEDSRAAVVLTSIDYSKAFNRLNHLTCLQSFAKAGASNQLLRLLASFLKGRTMTVRVNDQNSKPRYVNAGAPQGSVLGTYVFNVGTDALEEGFNQDDQERTYQLNEGDLNFLELAPATTTAHSTPTRQEPLPPTNISPVDTRYDTDFLILPKARNVPQALSNRIEPTWRKRPVSVIKFVDDNLTDEKLYMKDTQLIESQTEFIKNARAGQSERMFKHISDNAGKAGLKVNTDKTTLLAVSAATSYRAKTHLYDQTNTRIDCSPSLKALGFIFNEESNVDDQVEHLCKRFRLRTWALRDLRKAGLSTHDLVTVYKTTIRPIIEYSSVIYHPMLTAEQTEYIEKQQTRALKNIFGNEHSRRKLLELSDLPLLKKRREEACLRFAKKMANNPRFSDHFRLRKQRPGARETAKYVEQNARTNRRRNSPYFYYRRILNESVVRYV